MKFFLSAFAIVATIQTTQAVTLTNGSLAVDIRNDNGAIDTVSFGGTDYFNPGTAISDWGFQTSTNTSTFVANDTSGGTGQTVSVSPSAVVTGNYTAGGSNVSFSRAYTIVSGTNTLRIDMAYLNLGSTITLRQFETFDPDQGASLVSSYDTYNDVFSLASTQVGQAAITGSFNHTVVLGSTSSPYVIASGNPFNIGSGSTLNGFFSSPFDGNGSLGDSGMHIGFERSLATSQSASYSIFIAFGTSSSAAQTSYVDAINAVPEPNSAMLSTIAALGLLMRRRR